MIDYLNELVVANWRDWYAATPPPLSWQIRNNGGTALHDNVVCLGTPLGQAEPVLVAKVCRWPAYSHTVEGEFAHLTAVWRQLGAQAIGRIPRPLHLGRRGADPVLVTDYFNGRLLSDSLRDAVKRPFALSLLFQRVAAWLRLLHEQTTRPQTEPLPPPYRRYADQFTMLFALSTTEQRQLDQLVAASEAAAAHTQMQLLQHGDFWPGNILIRARTDQIALIDWQFASWCSNPNFDLYFLLLASAAALSSQPTPQARGQQVVRWLVQWQEMLVPAYLQAYGQPLQFQLLPPKQGLLLACVIAAVRPLLTFGVVQDDAMLWRTIFQQLVNNL